MKIVFVQLDFYLWIHGLFMKNLGNSYKSQILSLAVK